MNSTTGWGVSVAAMLAATAGVAGVTALEPTVTAREAQWLEQAAAVAVTNAPQAILMLTSDRREPASAAIDFAVGNFHFQLEDYEAAITAYQEAVRKRPAFRRARKNMGRAWLLLDREDEAISVYRDLVADGHFDTDIFLLLGHGLMLRGHAVPAESAYRQALLLEPESRDARQGLMQALLDQQRYAETRNLTRTALDADPGDPGYWSLLANVEVALGDREAAIRAIETARRLDACAPLTRMLLGDLYLDAGRPTEAVAVYEEARVAGGIETARFLRAVEGLVLLGEGVRAEALLKTVEAVLPEAEKRVPATVRAQTRLRMEIAVLAGDSARAMERCREWVALDPIDGQALLRLGDLLAEAGETGEAELTYERAGRLAGHETESLARRARLAMQANRIDEAVTLLENAERITSRPHIARYLEQLRRLAD